MEQPNVRILGIAPYEAMKTVMLRAAENRPQIELDVYVGDLKKGAEIARKNFHSNYDVIISRGGTAEMIGKITHIPVIEISLSVYDILRAMKLAENYSDKYAVVGFPSITGSAHLLCDLLQYRLEIVTIHGENEVEAALKELKSAGCRMVLCDMIANTTAKRMGLNSILITSGSESIENAFDQAVKLCAGYASVRAENRLLKEIMRREGAYILVFDSRGEPYFSTWKEEDLEEAVDALRKELPEAQSSESHKTFKTIGGAQYEVSSIRLLSEGECYTAFHVASTKIPIAVGRHGIRFSNKKEAENRFYNSFYSIAGAMGTIRSSVEQMSQSHYPVMILGEEGTGKEPIVQSLYIQSPLRHNPLITVDCSLINEKSWGFLTNHYHSPFNDSSNTVYFKNIDKLSESKHRQLLSMILDMNVSQRNRLFFSCVSSAAGKAMPNEILEYVNNLSCLTIHLPPLRERPDDLPTLSSLYLGALNVELAKQIIGFEPDAMRLLQQYDWPYNHNQFKRVLNELAVITEAPYISEPDVQRLLGKERAALQTPSHDSEKSIDLSRSLSEITKDVIQAVLNETGGNQSAAAKRLCISRTTLWRYLK